ncbi:hypothetical protein [Halobacteriaceae bacterium SHR40]|uniref:hypothetical protein n=1 Tax=Halovenus amylolytica TaxID=2500550 RepID=UPI000FE3D4DB
MIRDRLLSEVKDADIAYMYDPRENSRWGLLRGIPALYYLGVNDFTYPTSWCQFNRGDRHFELDYEYHVVSNGLDIPDSNPEFGVVTNDHYEHETPYTIKYLINRYTVADATLFVLTDSKRFEPQDAKRPLYQDPCAELIGSYNTVYDAFERAYNEAGWQLPLTDTKNLFLQDNANLFEFVEGRTVTTTTELFSKLPENPYLPLYDAMSSVFSRPDELGTVPLDGDNGKPELVRWLRRRIEWDRDTARGVVTNLNQAVIDDGSRFDKAAARRTPAVRDAYLEAKKLDSNDSPINNRYTTWLQRYNL